ncbi:PREDICTED: kinesin-like protein KIN-7O [Camelina sativa]|uniref:Kinesin-like protein KIN-7O n=1 Tax=Camelina sativa TaxID=90675 RepID=A0ABM0SZV4_CAMSA|nr:PREDICTED: kinesin-like protein KIN-7O [Camelina sativa]
MERIHVSVRARPLSSEDAKTSPWKISSDSIFMPNQSSPTFDFDRIFREDCKTVEVYEARTKAIVSAAVCGFNGTVFAYGQTNSGKTHTMRGSPIEPGVIPLAVHDLFDTIYQDTSREFLLRMSYLEIYNEDINDLLAPEHRKLQIHENLEKGIFVAGLREEIVASPQQVLEMMEFGESHRHIGETNMNLYSSRSHTIFRMIIESRQKMQDEGAGNACDAVRVSVLNLVDLAGSERAAKTGAEGVRLKEGSHINKSLMTLGTVIKKLSEGVENQGGHVPYRDSKLTRILQPALGGNANTAIICNITLAPIHADETKSSLQFASRALRVTNCAHVNEILTDAALLKRQKKEIEELRSKLKTSHSDRSEEEILNLRNTLLKSELERERIALELEEEKKAQAQRERVLQEQAKKIKNLSSMVLLSNRDEKREQDHFKKGKRRDTWCISKVSRDSPSEVQSNVLSRGSSLETARSDRETGPLLPFSELVNEPLQNINEEDEDSINEALEASALPDPCSLVNVTSRKKPSIKQKSHVVVENESDRIQREYEDLFLQFETERIISEIQIEFLKAKLGEEVISGDRKCKQLEVVGNVHVDEHVVNLRDPESILLIKQLQEKINILELEKSSSNQSLDDLVTVATKQNICAREKLAEIEEEIHAAREETQAAREQLVSKESEVSHVLNENLKSLVNVATEVEVLVSEFQKSKASVETVSSVMDEGLQDFAFFSSLIHDFTSFMHQSFEQHASQISSYQNVQSCLKQKVLDVENEKLLLQEQCSGLQSQIEELNQEAQKHETSLMMLSEHHESERSDLLSHIEDLEKDIASLSSSSLAKEKENIRKDLEKTKTKLKDTESKLKNSMQDKTKLEAEKASAERELKRLHSQKALLERDISKHESFASKRRDSLIAERSTNQLQEDFRQLEVLAFEMETTIASLEEELVAERGEKEEALCRNDGLDSEIAALTEKLEHSNTQLEDLQKDVTELEDFRQLEVLAFEMETTIASLEEELVAERGEKEEALCRNDGLDSEIAALTEKLEHSNTQLEDLQKDVTELHLANSLLEMEEEKAIWSSKEKALTEAMEEKIRLYNIQIESLSKEMSEAKKQLESCRLECVTLADRLRCSEENAKLEKECSMEKSLEIDRLSDELRSVDAVSKQTQEVLNSDIDSLKSEVQRACEMSDTLRRELNYATSERQGLLSRIEELSKEFASSNCSQIENAKNLTEELTPRISSQEANPFKDAAAENKEKAKLKMRLRGTQARLDAICLRHKQSVQEIELMNRKFEEASTKLKEKLASKALEVVDLKKQLSASSRTKR